MSIRSAKASKSTSLQPVTGLSVNMAPAALLSSKGVIAALHRFVPLNAWMVSYAM